ncbi:MAG TPA: cytidylate kinase family protein [Candidatus Sulfotelmatobacter sp.]|nr:cytidylate kinase family protein [Candidatus Sulfotelmatobacter sp.]
MSVIAISRGSFSGGEAVAKALAARLGYRCVSREVLFEAAWGYGVPADEVMTAMERRPPFLERMAGIRSKHLILVRAALCEQAQGGSLIYHGHLGHLLLPGIAHVIGVRVIADMTFRVASVMREHGFTHRDALAYIQHADRERRQWTRFLFGVEWDDPQLYDVVMNLSRMSVAAACDLLGRLTETEEFRPSPASLKAMRDLTLRSRVAAALATDRRTRDLDVEVAADEGKVVVTGTTQSSAMMEAVAAVAGQVEGVTALISEVRLLREGAPVAAAPLNGAPPPAEPRPKTSPEASRAASKVSVSPSRV